MPTPPDERGHGTGDVNRGPKMGDYSGGGVAGGLHGVGGGVDRSEAEYRGGGERYRGDGGQSGSQAGGLPALVGKAPAGSDERVREDVCEALAYDAGVDAGAIEVAVEAGEVTLTGTVADGRGKQLAEDRAAQVTGVHGVHNRLRLAP